MQRTKEKKQTKKKKQSTVCIFSFLSCPPPMPPTRYCLHLCAFILSLSLSVSVFPRPPRRPIWHFSFPRQMPGLTSDMTVSAARHCQSGCTRAALGDPDSIVTDEWTVCCDTCCDAVTHKTSSSTFKVVAVVMSKKLGVSMEGGQLVWPNPW